MNYMGVRYITTQEDYQMFDTDLATNFISTFHCINKRAQINWTKNYKRKQNNITLKT